MALDNALHFLDELKDKYMHEVDKAIEDWDYQDFSPDKRTPLLDNEIVGDAVTDLSPDPNALQQIKDASRLDWVGLSRDDMLNDQAFGRPSISLHSGASYEARVLAVATPAGGVQGIPDSDAIQRFLQHAVMMNPHALAEAVHSRLQEPMWQIRSKTLVVVEILMDSPDLLAIYLPALRANRALIQTLDKIRVGDHNQITRENARKVLSLIHSNGADAMLVAREPLPPKMHIRHSPVAKKKKEIVSKPQQKLDLQTAISPLKKPAMTAQSPSFQVSSPKIAAAALASWRRRSQKELLVESKPSSAISIPPLLTKLAPPPAPTPSLPRTSSMTLPKSGSSRSAFTYVDQPPSQPRVSITASRTSSFR